MYATELRLTNFKRFASLTVDLSSNITLLLGPNSSGKSSVIKALLGLKQTASPANEHEVFSAQGEYVDLGIYRDYVFEHSVDERVSIGIQLATNLLRQGRSTNSTYVELCFGRDFITEQARLLEVVIADSASSSPLIRLTKKLTRDSYHLVVSERFARAYLNEILGVDRNEIDTYLTAWTKGLSVRLLERYQFVVDKTVAANAPTKGARYLIAYPVHMLSTAVSSLLRAFDRNFYYLGPLRRSPSRSYSRTAHLLSVGASGEHTPSVLANLKSRAARERSKDREQAKRLEQLAGWIDRIFPGRTVDSKALEELVKLEIERDGSNREVISDVGFGFSQVLPILIQAAVMPADSTLLIEQPELHLHPQAQTRLAEVFSEASANGRRFVIETHSEHFVRGLQLAVSNGTAARGPAKQRLRPTDVKFLYVPRAPQAPREMKVDIWGEFLEPWPSGFFDEAYLVAMKLLQNKIAAREKVTSLSTSGDANTSADRGDT